MKDGRAIYGQLRPNENAILAHWDSGASIEQIAEATGFRTSTIENTLSRFDGASDYRIACNAMRKGSADLLAAMGGMA